MADRPNDTEAVFRALGDPTRRQMLDRLRERDGQSLGDLCSGLDMARQSATQHLDILVEADLVTVVRRGRQRCHYLNPVPIHDIGDRWISRFDEPRLRAISSIRHRAEEDAMTDESTPTYVYVTYIRASAEQVWHALTDADLTAQYWGHANVSDWEPGSTWEHRRTDGSDTVDVAGTIVSADPPSIMVITFGPPDHRDDDRSLVTFLVEPNEDIVRLTVTHERLADQTALDQISHGWPAVLANLKSLLETGEILPQAPWEMDPVH